MQQASQEYVPVVVDEEIVKTMDPDEVLYSLLALYPRHTSLMI